MCKDVFRLLLAFVLPLFIPGKLFAKGEGMLRLRPNTYSFRTPDQPFGSITFKEEEGQLDSPYGMQQSFSLRLKLSLSEFDADAEVFSIRDVLSVRLRQHDTKDIRRQNYPAGKMPDGRVPVLEAGIRLHLPEGCTPVREGQPSVQEMVVGVPLALLPKPWGEHELVLSFTGVCWDMYIDGALVDRDYALGYPMRKETVQWKKDAATVFSAELHVPGLVSSLKEEKGRTFVPVQYFTPRGHNAWVGDVATLWHGGRYHIFYLLDRRGHESKFGRGGHYFEHISTADFLHWTEHEAAVPIEQQWETLGTGTPFVWHDSLMLSYGMHTSRIWPSERTATPRQWEYIRRHGESQCVPFAHPFVSTEAIPSGASYSVSADGVAAFRKSHRLIHPAENPTIYTDRDGRLCMLANYGARGMWTTDCLDGGWHCLSEDFPPGGDCTFIFRWGDFDYIVGGFTHMWMKRASEQADAYTDMVALGEDLYDGLSVPSICELPDGRHLMAGWVEMNRHWGGPLVVRELIQYPDGRLGSRFMPELMPKAKERKREAGDQTLSPQHSYLLTFDVEPEEGGGRLVLHLSSDEAGKECVWTLDSRERTARFGEGRSLREGGEPQRATDYAIENLRGLEKPFTVKVVILNNPKFGGSLLDVEIAGQRTMISHREGLDVAGFRLRQQGLTIQNLRVSELDTDL